MTLPLIRLFASNDTTFTTLGDKVLQPYECIETKVIHDEWKVNARFNIEYADDMSVNKILVVPTKYGDQPFRIKRINIDGERIEVEAEHIGYDTKGYFIKSAISTTNTASACLTVANGATLDTSPFTVYSDITDTYTLSFDKVSLYDALVAIQATYGGYLDFDGLQIRLTATLGSDKGEVIERGKNLVNAESSEDWTNVVTKIYPVGDDGLTIVGDTLTSTEDYGVPYTKRVDFATDDATELATLAQAYLDANDTPKVNYVVEGTLQNVYLNDVVVVKCYQFDLNTNVLAYEYDTLLGRNNRVEFGNYRRTPKKAFSAIREQLDTINARERVITSLVAEQTALINAAGDSGYAIKTENEFYVMDTADKTTATNVVRINLAGIGFSTTGYSGTYSTAWTIDGKFNADYVQAGILNVNNAGLSGIGTTTSDIRIWAGNSYANRASAPFRVTHGGSVTMTSGNVKGNITVGTSSVNAGLAGAGTSSTSIRFWAGASTPTTSADFYVRDDGYMKAASGVIAGWTVNSTSIYKNNIKLDSANSRIYLNSSAYLSSNATSTIIDLTGSLNISSALTVTGNVSGAQFTTNSIIPSANETYSLGTSSFRFLSAYINGLYMKFGTTYYQITRDGSGFLKAV